MTGPPRDRAGRFVRNAGGPRRRGRDKRPYAATGVNTLKRQVRERGLAAFDGRSPVGRAVRASLRELLDHAGGQAATATQRRIVKVTVREELFLEAIDAWLLDHLERGGSLVVLRKKAVLPVLLQRAQLAESYARHLALLGLDRRDPKRVRDIGEAIAGAEPVDG